MLTTVAHAAATGSNNPAPRRRFGFEIIFIAEPFYVALLCPSRKNISATREESQKLSQVRASDAAEQL